MSLPTKLKPNKGIMAKGIPSDPEVINLITESLVKTTDDYLITFHRFLRERNISRAQVEEFLNDVYMSAEESNAEEDEKTLVVQKPRYRSKAVNDLVLAFDARSHSRKPRFYRKEHIEYTYCLNCEWKDGTRSNMVLEPKDALSDLIVEIQHTINNRVREARALIQTTLEQGGDVALVPLETRIDATNASGDTIRNLIGEQIRGVCTFNLAIAHKHLQNTIK